MVNAMHVDSPTIAVLGAGPIGLEAALYGRFLGYDVHLYEQAEVGHHVREWGHVELFTPFGMNRSPLALAALKAQDPEWQPPDDEALLTGDEHVERFLLPLSQTDLLAESLHLQTRVLAIGRSQRSKADFGCGVDRDNAPFRLLLCDSEGRESSVEADIIIDATGVYSQHRFLGAAGLPAVGERQVAEKIYYQLPLIGREKASEFAGRHALVVGGGYSAATSIVALAELATVVPDTRVTWVVRQPRGPSGSPLPEIVGDPLEQRASLTERANRLALDGRSRITYLPQRSVEAVREPGASAPFEVLLQCAAEEAKQEMQTVSCHSILAHVGFRPDCALFEELQVQLCHVSEGPFRLAAHLMGEASGDCLKQHPPPADLLITSEPNFYILGNKSYGRDARFLISVGLEQIRQVFSQIGENKDLDLYRTTEVGTA